MRLAYRPWVRFWLGLVAAVAAGDAWALLYAPQFIETGAYSFAGYLLPQQAWGGILAAVAGALTFAWWADRNDRWADTGDTIARLALITHGVVCGVYGLSIFVLTFSSAVSAIMGASKWWAFPIITGFALTRETWLSRGGAAT